MAFKIYKRGQGYYTRLYSALVAFVIVMAGCYTLHQKLQGTNVWVWTLVPAGICAGFGLLFYWLVNRPAVADFMISAESEIKKVSWSSRKEIFASTFIVICVVVLMSSMLLATDMIFRSLFMYVFNIY